MDKKELALLIRSLAPIIKKMVALEAKRIVKPMIKEAVENKVNKLLAEHFVSTASKRSLVEEMDYDGDLIEPVKSPRKPQPQFMGLGNTAKQTRAKLMERMGIDSSNPISMAFSDIDEREIESVNSAPGQGEYLDETEDDDGVDLSRFGVTQKYVRF